MNIYEKSGVFFPQQPIESPSVPSTSMIPASLSLMPSVNGPGIHLPESLGEKAGLEEVFRRSDCSALPWVSLFPR